jgi:alpha-1,2-mannosyltransferase
MSRLGPLVAGRTKVALVAGAVLWLLWAVTAVLGPGNLDRNGQVIGTDHTAFHTAAVLIADGRGDALYDYPALPVFARAQEEITGKDGFLDPYRNPPFYALLYRPTARLPYLASYGVWAVLGLFVLVGGLRLLAGRDWYRAVGWALCFYPVFAAVSFGQNTLLSFGVFALVHVAVTRQRLFLAGLAAGLLAYKPQLLFGLVVWWTIDVRTYWRAWLGMAATGCGLAGISLAVVPAETRAWVENLPAIARYDAFEFYNLHTWRGFGQLLTGDKTVGNVAGLAGMGLGVAAFILFRRRVNDPALLSAAAVFVTLWASPHTMTYEWGLAILPAVVVWAARPDLRAEWVALFALTWAAFFISTPLTKAQLDLTKGWFDGTGVALQISVPVMTYVAARAGQLLWR